ncbi:MAG: hypothetical protein ACAH59_09700 [Pseudobdellovibrionaceae bacterium]
MVRDILDSVAVGKLKGILKDRYGKGLRVNFMQEVSSLEIKEDGFLLSRGDLHVPIQVNDKFLATAIVDRGASLQKTEQETVSQLIRLFLEPELFNWYVEQMTHNAKAEPPEEVISIFQPFELSEENQKTTAATNILCLQAKNPHLIPRLAQNIHEVAERWAFLKFSDIQDQVKTPADLKSLGALTLLIEDILNLSPEMQDILHLALADGSPADEPLLLIGCTTPVEELQAQGMLHPGLAKIMKVHRLEVERLPRDPKLMQETLEIMLEF